MWAGNFPMFGYEIARMSSPPQRFLLLGFEILQFMSGCRLQKYECAAMWFFKYSGFMANFGQFFFDVITDISPVIVCRFSFWNKGTVDLSE